MKAARIMLMVLMGVFCALAGHPGLAAGPDPAAASETAPPPAPMVPQLLDAATISTGGFSSASMKAPAPASPSIADFTRQEKMSLDQAKAIALQNNPDVENARRDLRMAELEIIKSKANYDPYVQVDASYSDSNKPSSQSVFGSSSKSSMVDLSSGVNTTTGGSLTLDFRSTRSESDSVFSSLNPSYSTDLTLNVRQPLLKNRYNNTLAMELEQKQNDYKRSKLSLDSKVMEIEAQVEEQYWSLTRSYFDLELKRRALALSDRMDKITRAQVKAGSSAPVSIQQTEANLASARAAELRAVNDYRKGQATFKMLLNLADPEVWTLEIVPSDMPRYSAVEINPNEFLKEAMANNIQLQQARYNINNTEIGNQQAKNRALPQLDFRGSVGVSGLAGTDNPTDTTSITGFVIPNPLPPDQFPQPYMIETRVYPGTPSDYAGDYMDSVNNMLDGDNLSWSAGVTFRVPIGNRAAKADLEKNQLSYEKQLNDLHYQERQVFLNLINLLHDAQATKKSLDAAREADQLQEKNLQTEEKKYSVGLNTSYEVMQAEQSFEEARSSEIGALIEYTKIVGRLERARKGYLSSSGGLSSFSLPTSLPSSLGSGSLPSGIDSSMLQQYSSMLPAGVDMNMLMQYLQ